MGELKDAFSYVDNMYQELSIRHLRKMKSDRNKKKILLFHRTQYKTIIHEEVKSLTLKLGPRHMCLLSFLLR